MQANESTEEPGEWAQIEESLEDDQAGIERSFHHTLTDLDRATDYNAKLSVRNTHKGTEEAYFNFSTKKGKERKWKFLPNWTNSFTMSIKELTE